MKLADHLSEKQKQQLNQLKTPKKKRKKKKEENVNWEEIMGMNMQVLRKKNGVWRRK